jgi:CDGSH-type Zn-finger protein/uncharacterized Fe-S cluster protein YjdI
VSEDPNIEFITGKEVGVKKRKNRYERGDLTVTYESSRCIHAAECVRGLPAVFVPGDRPWIKLENAAADELITVIERCPTGALQYECDSSSVSAPELPENTVKPVNNGPLYVAGNIRITDADGELVLRDTRAALCRCGRTRNRPFCDNSHRSGFQDSGELGRGGVRYDETAAREDVLEIKLSPDGPLLLSGSFEILDAAGDENRPASKSALCRCGASANKPFCDGSHRRIGFKTEGD